MAALVSSSTSKSSRLQQADNDDGGQSKPEGQTTNSIVVDTNPNDDDDDQQESKAAIEQSKRGDKTTTTTEAANNNSSGVIYDVEHLATFSTSSSGDSRVSDRDGRATNVDRRANTTTDAKGPPVGHKLSQFQSTSSSSSATEADPITEPREALQKLFELEKLSGIWTQRMQIELREDLMLIVDCETNAIVERFHRLCVTKPEAFSHYNDIYNNIIVFIIQQRPTEGPTVNNPGELHIFQCVTHKAQQLLADILAWKSSVATTTTTTTSETTTQPQTAATSSSKMAEQPSNETVASTETNNRKKAHDEDLKGEAEKQTVDSNKTTGQSGAPATQTSKPVVVTVASSASATDTLPIVNVNVKETVQVFNQIAALREKGKPNSPTTTTTTTTTTTSNQATGRPLSDASIASGQSGGERATSCGQLSSSGQLYKQRSIRATLAPATGDKSDKSDGQQAASTSSSSMTSSSEMTSNSSGQPTSCPADQQRPTNGTPNANGNQRAAATGANGNSNRSPPTGRPSGHHHHNQQQQQSSSSSSSSSSAAAMAPAATQAQQHHNGATSNSNISKSSKSRPANGKNNNNNLQQQTSSSSSARTHDSPPTLMNQQQLEQVATNESYVSVLNHCFDDIEKFIIRLQQAAAALRELQAKRKLSKRSSISSQVNGGQPMPGGKLLGPPMTASEMAHLSARARGPAEDDYFEILSKFKLAFNLLAKLKGCIHEPNAPELVHFLFTPLAIIIDSARNVTPPIDPTLVGIPYLNKDALELLSNCCTSKESDMWLSLGPNWTQTIDINLLKASRLPSSFQPIFSDGWAPIITELELIGLVRPHQLPPPVQATHTNGTGSSNGHQPTPADDVQQRRRASNLESEQTTTMDAVEGGHYGTPRNGRSLHESLGSSTNRQVPVNGHRAPKKRSSPPMGYATANYAADLHEPFEDAADSYGYRVPGQYQSRYASAAPAGRPKSGSRRSAALGQPGDHFGSMVGPTTEPINELMLDGYLGSSDLLPSDDYTELHTGPDFYAPAMHNGHDHLAGPSSHHYRRSRQLQPRYSLPDNIGRPRRSGSSSMGTGYMQRPGQAYLDSAPGYEQPGSFNEAAHMTRVDEAERQAMLVDLGPAQTDWLLELQARQALIVRVLFTREANNDKELSVRQGEILEVLDDSRKWWKARNIELQVAHVPHTIVAVIEQYQTLDELLTNGGGDVNDHHSRHQTGAFVHQKLHQQRMHSNRRLDAAAAQQVTDFNQNYGRKESKRNSKTAGAFRYF